MLRSSLSLGVFCVALTGVVDIGSPIRAQESQVVQRRVAARRLSETINHRIEQRWSEEQVIPTEPADDATFLRRVYLDLAGKIPTAGESRRFLNDSDPDKRLRLVEDLLDRSTFVTHFSTVWTDLLIPEARSDLTIRFVSSEFEAWLRRKFDEQAGFDEIVREILTVPLAPGSRTDAYAFYSNRETAQPTAFFAAKQVQPENLAASTARTFMGLRVECAQCHDHPFADWTREQFWGYAAFFNGIRRRSDQPFGALIELFQAETPDELMIGIPDTNRLVSARFLDGTPPESLAGGPRRALADWLLSPQNPYFARATANRLWAIYFGVGLVDPVDDFDPGNPASHPELLQELATSLPDNRFDLRVLVQAIVLSRPYQLSSRRTHPSQDDIRLFARMAPRILSADQVFASLQQAIGLPIPRQQVNNVYAMQVADAEFRRLFTRNEERTIDGQTSVLQALTLMNGSVVSGVDASRLGTVAAVAEMPWLTLDQKIESLYLAALSRPPQPRELSRLHAYVEAQVANSTEQTEAAPNPTSSIEQKVEAVETLAGEAGEMETVETTANATVDAETVGDGSSPDALEVSPERKALADIFWALLNSSEFLLNH